MDANILIVTFVFAFVAHAPEAPAFVEIISPFPSRQRHVGVSNAKFFAHFDRFQRHHVNRHVTVILNPRGDFAIMIARVVGGGVEHEHPTEDGWSRINFLRAFPDGKLQQLPKSFFVQTSHVRHPSLQVRLGWTKLLDI